MVIAINIAEASGAPTFPVDEIAVIPARGLDGDRIVREAGDRDVAPKRQVTLIESEALEAIEREQGIALSPAASRRNICTRDVALNHLVGQTFRVGDVTLRGVELCEPCGTLERLTGIKGLVSALLHRGGLRAEIVEGGTIRVGDAVERT